MVAHPQKKAIKLLKFPLHCITCGYMVYLSKRHKPWKGKDMKTENAIKKLEKNGFVQQDNVRMFVFAKPGCRRVVEFLNQNENVICLGFRDKDDHSDVQSDYCATIFCDSLKQAMTLAGVQQ